ncbi:RED-like N-terminal domain-containing protein [Madurella fahalii]|uniref:RED-like N-terminal domain-containing protein n=1 Tax=Madurella fahalii TaxID=1157608 RepID=A0ABQ0FZL1_9PEZI
MNNEQFRRLMLANSAKPDSDKNGVSPPSSRPASSTPVALGSRLKSSIPMTPRSVAGGARVDFAKQLAERNKAFEKTQKKIRTSAPKGSRLAEGYVDRAKARQQEEDDERAARLEALEESFKKEEIDRETYDRLRSEIAGGDLSSTHLVKGLDFKLLERIRRGEDVYGEKPETPGAAEEDQQAGFEEDPDDALEQLESTEVKAITREKTQKKGQFATTTLNPGQKRSRNQILAELKAARAAAKAKEESSLGSKFKKIGAKKTPGTRIETDSRGREVMIIVDEDGHERRKVRKLDPKAAEELEKEKAALASGKVLGMEVPEFYRKQQEAQEAEEEEKEVNIFDDAGSDYDPLADLEGSDDSSDEKGKAKDEVPEEKTPPGDAASADMPPPPKPGGPPTRNYFKDSKTGLTSEETYKTPSLDDPAFLAALKKAKAVSALEKSEEEQKAAEREERLKKKLGEISRDDEDLDLGFGFSRVEDEADLDETKVKLSAWGEDDDDEKGGGGGAKSKRKRGSKKKKGDKNNFEDVMKVIQRNKGGG